MSRMVVSNVTHLQKVLKGRKFKQIQVKFYINKQRMSLWKPFIMAL